MTDLVEKVAQEMRAKRRDLIAKPLERCWDDLARATIRAVEADMRDRAAKELEANWGHICTPEMRDAILALPLSDGESE